ncbi:MAG: matrixin family metalloprotease [Bdellovibrionales bacterium]|nr:matrixin family metalloprotease [Bdellovibrionales bacterium]
MIGVTGISKSPLNSILAYSLISSLFFMGCAKENKRSNVEGPKVQTYFVNGDPMNFISGSTGEPSTPFEGDQIREANNYLLRSINEFMEKEVAVLPNPNQDIEEENAPSDNDPSEEKKPEVSQAYNMIEKPNGVWSFESQYPSQPKFLLNSDTNGKFKIFEVQVGEKKIPVTPIHFSCSQNCQMMSFLGRYDAGESGSSLVAFYWTKNEPTPPISIGTKVFNYIFGKGVKIPWSNKSPLPVKICGAETRKIEKPIRQAIESWSQLLTDRLEIELETTDTYPPFSDLNFHCIQFVDNYLTEQDPDIINTAITLSERNPITNQMQDSDIFIFAKERRKVERSSDYDFKSLVGTVRHEFGHLLTLDHEFELDSIMSYNRASNQISLHDAMAISNLYPRTKPMQPRDRTISAK